MQFIRLKSTLKIAAQAVAVLFLGAGGASGQQQVNLTAGSTSITMPDGSSVPMWGYSCVPLDLSITSSATCAKLNPAASGWSPVVITVPTGQNLRINLTNALSFGLGANKIPTSLTIVGQVGGGLGSTPTTTPSPTHGPQTLTWPASSSDPVDGVNNPPHQGPRIQSFATEVAVGSTTALDWVAPRPGTYLLESGTHPSIQGPMGLFGMVVVTGAPTGVGAAGTAYPGVAYNAEIPLLFSEVDPVQNKAVQTAVDTAGFSETKVWSGQPDGCGNPASATYNTCYPPTVNYSPRYYLINGVAFDKTHIDASKFVATAGTATSSIAGTVLVRLVNAGLRMHVPSIVGSQTGDNNAPGFGLIAQDGNPLPGKTRVQSEVFMAPGKTYDLAINVPPASNTALPIFDRQGSLSGNGRERDAGMLAYISINGAAAPNAPSAAALARADTYTSVFDGQTLTVSDPTKGVIANDSNVYSVLVTTGPTQGSLALQPDGTFTYTPTGAVSSAFSDTFVYCANGLTMTTACATVTLGAAPIENASGIAVKDDSYTSNLATTVAVKSPGVLLNDVDAASYPLSVSGATASAPLTIALTGGGSVSIGADGGFSATVPAPGLYSFKYKAKNSQGTESAAEATVTLNFPTGSGILVKLVDGKTKQELDPQDYRWIIEEDRTFYQSPNCTGNPTPAGCPGASSGIVPAYGTNFHTSHMPVIAQGCTGANSCEGGQTLLGAPAVCDVGNGICRIDASTKTVVMPGEVVLDPAKRYYISVLPGDGFDAGHVMGGAEVYYQNGAWQPVNVIVEPGPLPTATVSAFVFEDDFPMNGEDDTGGGVDVLAPNEPGLGGFNVIIYDNVGQFGDPAGQMTYDMFNQPLSNALAGTIDPATKQDACPIVSNSRTGIDGGTSPTGLTGVITVCPKYEADSKTLSPLAGQVVVRNLPPGFYGVEAHPGADRIARGEEWLQTNTLDGGFAHDAFIKASEPSYFQEYGPAGFHVAIGFANPAIINGRHPGVCANRIDCNHTITGKVTLAHMSRTPDERLYSTETNDAYAFTQTYVSLGSPDGADFAFARTADDGTFTFTNMPGGDWRVTVFDQWTDLILDGYTTPVRVESSTVNMGDIAVHQWRQNLYTRTFFDENGDGVSQDTEPGLTFVPTNIRYRDGSYSNFNSTDLDGFAGFNEVFPIFNWYVVETDSTRYKNTGTHVVYDAGGPVDGSTNVCGKPGIPKCGNSVIANHLARTSEDESIPADLRIPGSVYCNNADCTGFSIANGPASSASSNLSTGRIDPPWVQSYGWQGFLGQAGFLEFGKKPFAEGENGGIRGHVIYASTRPFDDPALLLQLSWEPMVPNVTINLYQEGTAPDGSKSLKLVDTTQTSSWDEWAQGFRKNADGSPVLASDPDHNPVPNISCPGQSTSDPFYFTLYNQPELLNMGTPLPYNSQYKCFDGMHNWNQLQPAPYNGMYQFPSVTGMDPHTGKPTGTNCLGCTTNTAADQNDWNYGQPMLPPGKYVVEMIVPAGYELVKEEDKNILMGDSYDAPVTQQFAGFGNIFILPDQAAVGETYNPNNPLIQNTNEGATPRHEGDTGSVEEFWPCVGAERTVPDYLSLYPQSGQNAPFAGATRPLCDRKEVTLGDQASVLAKFYVFTSTHIAGHFTGIITDDFTSEFDPFSPAFGEKFEPPYLPVSVKDWAGNEVSRVYSDQWGIFNGLAFSSWGVNPPDPSGFVPQTFVMCMNDRGTGSTPDPLYSDSYSQFCYEWPMMPGETSYLDTPVVPNTAFAEGYNHPDCEYPDLTPAISEVDGDGVGPWVGGASGSGALSAVNPTLNFPTSAPTGSGSGYSSAPTVTISAPPAGAGHVTATAAATISGSVTAINFNPTTGGGSGYTSTPLVNFVGGGGSGATATVTLTGRVSTITVGAQGGGYTSRPTVSFSGGGGSGAVANTTLSVFAVNVSNGGSHYHTNNPGAVTVTFGAAPAGGVRAQGTVQLGANGTITGVTVTNAGSGYTSIPSVTFGGTHPTGGAASGSATVKVSRVNVTNGGTGYNSAPIVAISAPPASGIQATATANLTSVVNSVTLTDGGSGYASAPQVQFVPADGHGSGATATSTISGSVVSISLNNPGSAYITAPTITFTGGGGSGAAATATLSNGQIIITALGDQDVSNNGYSGPMASAAPFNQKTIKRHYGFGSLQCITPDGSPTCNTKSSVTIGGKTATITHWDDSSITVNVPAGVPNCALQQQAQYGGSTAQCGELVITAGNGKQSIDAVTVTIAGKKPKLLTAGQTVQSAIDAAAPGDMIIVPRGSYKELLIMWKPVRLQGVAAASTVINGDTHPSGVIDPWRHQISCLFGLALNGQPYTGNGPNGGTNPYDSTNQPSNGGLSCPGNGWNYFGGQAGVPQVDRIPFEGILGWDTTVNGNLAEMLQEPTLMGSYEGAGITVLAKGVRVPAGADWFGVGAEAGYPDGTTLLSANDCLQGGTNPFPSNFYCNPSRIDGLMITNSSQGGGGILVHGWGHNIEISNNRVRNNNGTLSGGIEIGQGEFGDGYFQGAATTPSPGSCQTSNVNDTQLPYCFNTHTSVHHNMVTLNSSTGDELFTSTPSGGGGVTFCIGSDYYKLNYNWICGNMSSGDGGGIAHLGFSYNGDISKNTIIFNQTVNPTIPTSGGGIIVMGPAPDGVTLQGVECGSVNDEDCVPGLSDGSGPGLNIDGNLILGNAAESGSGGGIRFQAVNGTEVARFPLAPQNWYSVNVTNNIIANNVAGWDGAGVGLLDALAVNFTNNTIVSNDTTASAGTLFNAYFARLAADQSPPTGTCINDGNGACTASQPQPAGLSASPNSPQLTSSLPANVRCPAGHYVTGLLGLNGECKTVSYPQLSNDIFWQNRAFHLEVGGTATGGHDYLQSIVMLAPSLNQTSTGACLNGASYWDIGVRGDTSPTNHSSGITLTPQYSVLTNLGTDYAGHNNLAPSAIGLVKQYCNGSRMPPEFASGGYQVPPGTNEGTVPVPVFNLEAGATVDEGNNWVNMKWGPLAMTSPMTPNGAALFNYAPASGSPAIDVIPASQPHPATDFFGNPRPSPFNLSQIDVGAVEFQGAIAPTYSISVNPTSLAFGAVALNQNSSLTLTVTNTGNQQLTTGTFTFAPITPFTRNGGTCVTTLNASASCTVIVRFAPTTSNTFSATLTIAYSNGVSVPVPLSGTGSALVVTPASLDFGSVGATNPGTASVAQTLTLRNASGGTRTITGITFTGPFSRATAAQGGAGSCATTLANNATCTINVVFTPIAVQSYTGTASITVNGGFLVGNSPVSLAGVGATPNTTATLTPTTWTPSQTRNCPGSGLGALACLADPSQQFTLTNTGNVNMTGVSQGSLTGANTADFARVGLLSSCGPAGGGQIGSNTTLAPGATCTVTIAFRPLTAEAAGPKTATINVTDSFGTQAVTINATAN
jgi:hypothetical protein